MAFALAPHEPAHAGAVRRLDPGGAHQPGADEPRLRRSLVALDGDGTVVGVATATASARHPVHHHVVVDVDPSVAGGPVGGLLLDGLAADVAGAGFHRRWMAVCDTGDRARVAFLEAHGFRRVVTSRTGVLPVAAVASVPPAPVPDSVTVEPAAWSDDVVALYEDLYDESHWWTPYVRFARGVPWASFLGEPVPGTVVVARDRLDRPVSVASVHERDGRLFLAPTLVRHGARRPDAAAVLAALVDRSVAAVDAAQVVWEVDDTAPELGVALARFPVEVEREIAAWATPHLPTVP
jgi:hypothetical protein